LTKHWLLPRVKKLLSLNSRIRLEINSIVQQRNLAASDLDFVIRMWHPGENELIGRRVGTVTFGIFASQACLTEYRAPPSLAEMVDLIIGNSADLSERTGRTDGVADAFQGGL
jgi:DNA-binding transcriptional LysR family regulator